MIWINAVTGGIWFMWSMALVTGILCQLYCQVRDAPTVDQLWQAAGRLHQELWIAVPPGILLSCIDHWHHRPWLVAIDALSFFNWWWYRNWPDENRWKRRGRKLKDAVAVRAGRLVVVPAGASS